MVTNKGMFLAALILGLCIILASVITGAALIKSGKMRGTNSWQQSCAQGDREEGENREFRDGREDREEGEEGESREFRGGRRRNAEFHDGERGERHGGGGATPAEPGYLFN